MLAEHLNRKGRKPGAQNIATRNAREAIARLVDGNAEFMNRQWPQYQLHKTVMLAWDNTARRGLSANIFHNFSVDFYERWLAKVIKRTVQKYPDEEQLVFINAWNEWAEGTYLEPDQKYGTGYFEATKRAITAGQSWTAMVSSLHNNGASPDDGIFHYVENRDDVELALLKTIQEKDKNPGSGISFGGCPAR